MATVCSGVGAPEVAYHDLFKSVWSCEFDKFPSAVLKHRFPDIPNLGDMTKLSENEIYLNNDFDLLVGGTPCQGFSLAGKRGGLGNDERAQLTLEFVRILQSKQPKWFIWENVPGVFSSWTDVEDCEEESREIGEEWEVDQTNDFQTFIGEVEKLGYGLCWRVLDAQHFGVPQRRRRVFVVGYLGDWRPPYRVLFESEGLRGDTEKSESKREAVAGEAKRCLGKTVSGGAVFPTLTAAQGSKQWLGNQEAFSGDHFIQQDSDLMTNDASDLAVHGAQGPCVSDKDFCLGRNNGGENAVLVKSIHENQRAEVSLNDTAGALNDTAGALKSGGGKSGQGYPCLFRYSKSHRATHIDQRIHNDGTTNTLNTGDGCANQSTQNICVFTQNASNDTLFSAKAYFLNTNSNASGRNVSKLLDGPTVRKLTPLECERLQGFPDDWTKIPYRNKAAEQCPKGARYKAMGNSMAVPVMRWIGVRLSVVDAYMEL